MFDETVVNIFRAVVLILIGRVFLGLLGVL